MLLEARSLILFFPFCCSPAAADLSATLLLPTSTTSCRSLPWDKQKERTRSAHSTPRELPESANKRKTKKERIHHYERNWIVCVWVRANERESAYIRTRTLIRGRAKERTNARTDGQTICCLVYGLYIRFCSHFLCQNKKKWRRKKKLRRRQLNET